MYGLPEQSFKLTMLTSASVIALMKATPDAVPANPYPYRDGDVEVHGLDFEVE